LLSEIERISATSLEIGLREAWQRWSAFKQGLPTELRLIAENSNPEVVLTLPDLFALAASEEDQARFCRARTQFESDPDGAAASQVTYYDSAERAALSEAQVARARLVDCIDTYFWYRHHADREAGRESRDYLRAILRELQSGDVVITLNWDPLVERTLAEDGRWNPFDGYSLKRTFVLRLDSPIHGHREEEIPETEITPSDVRVLKLHGSFGWKSHYGRLWLESSRFLDEFPFRFASQSRRQHPLASLRDREEPNFSHDGESEMVYPSFLKQLDRPFIETIWRLASDALQAAERVDVWGYSLPKSDSAMRTLLNPLVARVYRGEAEVHIHDPSWATRDRWSKFFEGRASLLDERLG
jgi:hypothetical protein